MLKRLEVCARIRRRRACQLHLRSLLSSFPPSLPPSLSSLSSFFPSLSSPFLSLARSLSLSLHLSLPPPPTSHSHFVCVNVSVHVCPCLCQLLHVRLCLCSLACLMPVSGYPRRTLLPCLVAVAVSFFVAVCARVCVHPLVVWRRVAAASDPPQIYVRP